MREHLAPVYAPQEAHLRRVNALYDLARRIGSRWIYLFAETAASALPRPTQPTRQELEAYLNDGMPFEIQQVFRDWDCPVHGRGPLPYDLVVYTPPDGGSSLHLYFEEDRFVHAEDSALPTLKPPWGVRACNTIHQMFQIWGPRLWWFMLALPFVLRRHRVLLAELLAAVAILLVVAEMPSSPELFGRAVWHSLRHDADVAWTMCMVSISAAVLTWAVLRQATICRILCPLCGYNLRGNTSGCCPECGTTVPGEIRQRFAGI